MNRHHRVLVVEDEQDIALLIKHALERSGDARVEIVPSGDEALRAVAESPPDLVILDLNLPVLSGTEVCRLLRAQPATSQLPIIMLTARTSEPDRVAGLDLGADDYVTKPFSRPELLARIEAVLRRQRREAADDGEQRELLEFGKVAIDVTRREVTVDRRPVHLTTKEFDLLAHMAASPGRIFTRDQLLSRIWGYDYLGDGRTVDVHVSWLRGKLRVAEGHNYFRTVRGVGYAFAPRVA